MIATEAGYANGPNAAPGYQDVCAGSGHAETVRVSYDPQKISLTALLTDYFKIIDPLAVNRQGADVGWLAQRSRFCTVGALRDLFMMGNGQIGRAHV